MSLSRPPYDRFPNGFASPTDAYARELRRMPAPPPVMSEFVGMASYAPTYFLDIMDDDVGSDGSSIGDMAPSHRRSREYTVADAREQPLGVTESFWTHAPTGHSHRDPRAHT